MCDDPTQSGVWFRQRFMCHRAIPAVLMAESQFAIELVPAE
jgi:hypothetical protein